LDICLWLKTARFSDHVEKHEPARVLETSKDATITTTPNGMEGALPLCLRHSPRSICGASMAL
jgi:hypothetical protein